jgi:hypothetical protein
MHVSRLTGLVSSIWCGTNLTVPNDIKIIGNERCQDVENKSLTSEAGLILKESWFSGRCAELIGIPCSLEMPARFSRR